MLRQTKKQRHTRFSCLSLLILTCFSCVTTAYASKWQQLAPGLEYRDLTPNPLTPWSKVHIFRIDLKKQTLDLVTAHDLSRPHASAEEMAIYGGGHIAVNGGFFDTDYTPLGLRIGHHHKYSPLKSISWWGVFYTRNKKPYILRASQFKSQAPKAEFAIQSGPRLLINGKSPKLKPGIAERTALGITTKNRVILLVTDHAPMSTEMLANVLKAYPLYCTDALNLDGGSSTQLYANVGGLNISSRAVLGVSDAVIVKPRK